METSISATEDSLVDSLSFKLPTTANYIINREDVTFFPANGNEFSPTGVKILRFTLSGTGWLDPRSVRVQFKLNNRDQANNLFLVNALPSNFFRRLRILMGGTLIEDIDYYNRVVNMMHTIYPTEKRFNDAVEGFGFPSFNGENSWDSLNACPVVFPQASRVVLFPLMCGLLSQEKYLPLRFTQGIQIELEVVNQFTDCVLEHVDPVPTIRGQNAVAPHPQMSTNWAISEAQIKASVVTLDSQLDNEYTDHLMSGKNIPIPLTSFVHQVQTIGETDRPTLSMSRAFTRLNKVFITFFKVPYVWDWSQDPTVPDATAVPPIKRNALALHKPLRELNYFWHPNHLYDFASPATTLNVPSQFEPFRSFQGKPYQGNQSEIELQLQIGSKVLPVLPSRSLAEQYYQLRKGIMGEANQQSTFSITEGEYRTFKYINLFDLQKVPGSFSSGMSTRTGDLIIIKVLNLKHTDLANRVWDNTYADFIHATFVHDLVVSITDAGVTILE